ncbi:MAG: Na+/H+ antiporter subunit E [Actinomycetales bacterium]
MGNLRRVLLITAWVVLIWVGLWGDLSVANVLAGLAVGVFVSLVAPLPPTVRRYRPSVIGYVRLTVVLFVALAKATWDVAVRVLSPHVRLSPGIVVVEAGLRDPLVLSIAANATTMTPGTITLDVVPDRGLLVVHALVVSDDKDVEQVRADVMRFIALGEAALRPQVDPHRDLAGGAL